MLQIKRKLSVHFCVLCMLTSVTVLWSQNTHAQSKVDTLTDGNIRFFIEDISKITSGNLGQSPERITTFLNRHLHKHARFKSTLKYNIPGFPPQATALALNKDEFIENIEAGSKALDNYQNDVRIVEIKISSDKRKATVFTEGYETGTMNAQGQAIPVQGNSNCHQIVMLSKKGVIQMYNANCETTISFQDF